MRQDIAHPPAALRYAHVEVDLSCLCRNLARLRLQAGKDCRIFAVVKGDAYGAGLVECSKALEAAGIDGLAIGNADDVLTLRDAGVRIDILAYGSTPPDRAAALIGLEAILTIHDVASMAAVLDAARDRRGVRIMVKVDCGLARLGVTRRDLDYVFSTVAAAPGVETVGIYSHLAGQQYPARVAEQSTAFAHACAVARHHGVRPQILMLASSRVILEHPDLNLTAIDPGRLLFGLSRGDWDVGHDYETVLSRFSARIVQVSQLSAGSIPYGADLPLTADLRVGVVAGGTADGLVFTQAGQPVLIGGMRASQLGAPGIEHSMVDLSNVPHAALGDEVTYFGRDGVDVITPLQFAQFCGRPVDQAIPLVGRLARRVYRTS